MKNTLLTILCLAFLMTNAKAQIKTMIITKNDGTVIKFANDSIANITFSTDIYYEPSFSTMTDNRDGKVYKTVKINNQTWMAENLDYDVPGVFTDTMVGAVVDTANSSAPYCGKYGRFYDWNTLMNGDSSSSSNPSTAQGICPNGWHVPSDDEWKALEISLGMTSTDANGTNFRGTDQSIQMRSTYDWFNDGNGTNSSGMNILPTGDYSGMFSGATFGTTFWSSTEDPTASGLSWGRYLEWGIGSVERLSYGQQNGFPCRCVKN